MLTKNEILNIPTVVAFQSPVGVWEGRTNYRPPTNIDKNTKSIVPIGIWIYPAFKKDPKEGFVYTKILPEFIPWHLIYSII